MIKTAKEQFQEDLENFKEAVQEMAKLMIKEHQDIEPTLFLLKVENTSVKIGLVQGLGEFFMSDKAKTFAAHIMKEVNKELKPLAICFVCIGHITKLDLDSATPYVNPEGELVDPLDEAIKEKKDRYEGLVFIFETYDKESSVHYKLVRNVISGELELEKTLDVEWALKTEDRVGGLMSDLLPDNYDLYAEMINNLNNKENLN
jgi:hypothetical protein